MFGTGRRTRWILLVVALVAVAVAGVGWMLRDGGAKKADGGAVTAAAPSAEPLSGPRAAELSGQLASGREAELRKALVLPSGQALDPKLAGQLQGLGKVSFDLGTFRFLDGRSAEVEGTVTSSGRWVFTLLWLDGRWLLVDGSPKP